MSWKSKYANKQGGFSRGRPTKSQEEIEADQLFDQLRNKYANVIAFLLIKGVKQSELRAYFAASDENKRRYECIKKFR